MYKQEFERLFGAYDDMDTLTILELRDILVVPEEPNPEVEKFLDSRVLEYNFPDDTKQHRQISAMIKNKLLCRFSHEVTFRELLETEYFPKGMRLEPQVGIGCIRLLGDIYRSNGVLDVWKYKK